MSHVRRAAVALAVVLVTTSRARPAAGQGCVVVRPTPSAQGVPLQRGEWQLALAYRDFFCSAREFRGREEDSERARIGAEDINEIHAWTLDVAYAVTPRVSFALTVPYQIAERSEPIYSLNLSSVVARNRTAARGIGDTTIAARGWVVSPEHHPPVNVLVSAGLKLPAGADNATDTFRAVNASPAVHTVDASIQPGDGGIGFSLGFQAFAAIGRVSPYLTASYLVSPRETNGVASNLASPRQAFLSVPDSYVARAGAAVTLGDHVAPGLGVRLEGTPAKDLVGGSEGFRRPGYSVALEPSVTVTAGAWTFNASLPAALARARLRSVPEREDGTVGHASFADFSLLLGVAYRFGVAEPPAPPPPPPPPLTIGALPLALTAIGGRAPATLGSKLTLVNVWASWCKPCREEIPVFDEASVLYAARGVQVIGVSADDDVATANQYVHEVPFRYPSFWAGRSAPAALDVGEIPATFALDGDGRILEKRIGALSREDLAAWIDALLARVAP